MKKLSLIIFILFLSCSKNGNFEDLITNKDKHWFFYPKYPDLRTDNVFFYSFLRVGKIKSKLYFESKESDRMNFEKLNHNSYRWNYNKTDSILSFYDYNFKVVRFVEDTIVLRNLKSNTNQYFVNMKLSK